MAETDLDAKQIEAKVQSLAAAMERIKNAQADRDDVVVEMRTASRTRLELLAQALQPLFADLPAGNDQFEFALTSGELPRLWIDMTAFVRLAADRRTFEFVKDTRLGRTLIAASDNRETMARHVADYVAERVLERERIVEGDWLAMKQASPVRDAAAGSGETGFGRAWRTAGLVALGGLLGAIAMVAAAWFSA
jgi:hypothetical protein